jgi:hypothetical protein
MVDTVDTAVYRLSIEGEEEVDAAARSIDKLAVSEEKLTRATRTSGDAMEKLLGRLDPRIRAEQQLARTLDHLNRLELEGVGTAQQRAQALAAATNNYNTSIQRIAGTKAEGTFLAAGNAAKLSAFQIQNLSFQLQDVGQALLTGQPLFTTLIQQGSQISQIFGQGVGVAGAIKAVGGGIMSFLLNPLNLAVLGFAAAAATAQYFYRALTAGGEDSEAALERHKDLVEQVRDAYEAAGNSADNWRKKISAVSSLDVADNLRAAREELERLSESLRSDLSGRSPTNLQRRAENRGFIDELNAIDELNRKFSEGLIPIDDYRRSLDGIGGATASEGVRDLALALVQQSEGAVDAAQRVREAEDAFDAMNGTLKDTPSFLQAIEDGFKKTANASGEMSKATSELVKNAKAAAQAKLDLTTTIGEKDAGEFGAFNQLNAELREAETNLRNVTAQMRDAASAQTLSTLFPEASRIEGSNQALRDTVTVLRLLFHQLEDGIIPPQRLQEEIDKIRQSLVDMGLNSSAVDRLIDTFVKAALEAMGLRDSIDLIKLSLDKLPTNKTIEVTTVYKSIGANGGDISVTRLGGVATDTSATGGGSSGAGYIPYSIGGLAELPGKAEGGPVSAGQSYLVGEEGPELITMGSAGNVSTASATAAALTGGAGVLSMIEDNTYQALEEIRRSIGFLETIENNTMVMSDTLKAMRSGMSSGGGGSSGGGTSGGSSGGRFSGGGGGGGSGGLSHLDPFSPYVWNPALQPGGAALGNAPYDPVADFLLNGNQAALAGVNQFNANIGLVSGAGNVGPWGLAGQRQYVNQSLGGFDSGGYIGPGDSQPVQFFKRPDEAVAVLRPEQREAVGKAMEGGKVDRSVRVGDIHIHVAGDIGSRQSHLALRDEFGRRLADIANRV